MARRASRVGSASKIVLFSLLGIAAVLLGVDLVRGRLPQRNANKALLEKLAGSEDDAGKEGEPAIGPQVPFVTVEDVHETLRREPIQTSETTPTSEGDSQLIEIYSYPGVFNTYMLRLRYLKRAHVPKGGPATSLTGVLPYTKGLFNHTDADFTAEAPLAPPPKGAPHKGPTKGLTPDKNAKPAEGQPAQGSADKS